MHITIRTLMLAMIALTTAFLAPVARADDAAARAALQRVFPQRPVQSLTPSPMPGLLEAAIDGQLIYVTTDGRFVVGGPLLDIQSGQNLTEARLAEINAIPFETLPLDLAFKWVNGSGERRIAIFEDPDCPYCKKLEQTLQTVDDLTVYVFLFPIDQLHPDAAAKSRAVWCAPDRARAWLEIMRTGTVPDNPGQCGDPIRAVAEFAREHRISGTPTTILPDGRRLVGAVSKVEFERQLEKSVASRGRVNR